MDKIHIRGLRLRCIIGINPDEREKVQDVVLDLALHTDTRVAAASDDLSDTVDYSALKTRIVSQVESSKYHLLEALAESVARLCLEDARVERVDVRLDKPGALRFARSVAVEISRP